MGWSFKVFMLTAVGWSEHVGDDEGALLQIIQSGRTRETQKSFIATVAPPERQYTQYHEMNCYASAGATSLQHDLDFVGPTVSVADCMDACNSDATCSCVTVHETGGCWKRMSCTPSKCAHGSGWHTFTVNEELPQTSAPSGEMQPHIANCVHVHASGTRCTTCEEGYTPGQWSAAGTCRKCTCASDTCNCATCSAQGYCTSCKEGYVFDGAPQPHLERCNLPDPAPIANCVHVHASGKRCTTCEEGYTPGQWSAAGTCRKCTCASDTCNCATCTAQGYCTSCKEGYVFDGAPQPHLERCDPAP